jgi:putative transposase
MIAFIEDQRVVYGVESICRVLPIAPSTYYHQLACCADPSKASARHQRDTELRPEIKRVWDENYQVYGVRKAWHQLKREGFDLARCTVERPPLGHCFAIPCRAADETDRHPWGCAWKGGQDNDP